VLATTGVVGAAILLVGAAVLLRRLGRVMFHAPRSEDRGVALAALGALAAVAVHSAFDFGLSLPANSVTLAILCGAALTVKVERPKAAPPTPS